MNERFKLVKPVNGVRPAVFIPKAFSKYVDFENDRYIMEIDANNKLHIILSNKEGEKLSEEAGEFLKEVRKTQNEIISRQIDILEEIRENSKVHKDEIISEFKKELSNFKSEDFTNNQLHNDEVEKPEVELIPMKFKDKSMYRYLVRYEEQDLDAFHLIEERFEELGPQMFDDGITIKGYNIINGDTGATVKLNRPITWEDEFDKGKCETSIYPYFSHHKRYFRLEEDGTETQITLDEIYPYENEALYEFVNLDGTTYELSRDEIWFNPFYAKMVLESNEEILSKKMYEKFLNGEIKEDLTTPGLFDR